MAAAAPFYTIWRLRTAWRKGDTREHHIRMLLTTGGNSAIRLGLSSVSARVQQTNVADFSIATDGDLKIRGLPAREGKPHSV